MLSHFIRECRIGGIMTLKTAYRILKRFQKWRRGADIKIADVKQLGIAIDVILDTIGGVVK